MINVRITASHMKTVLLVRHAKSSWDDPAVSDFSRTLNSRGLRDAPLMANRLKERIASIDRIYSSAATRAKTTAGIFADVFNYPPANLVLTDELYLAPAKLFAQLIARLPNNENCIMMVAHNPGITDFANQLTRQVRTDNIPTAGIFAVSASISHWSDFEKADKQFLFFDYPKAGPGD